ncbi:hypothetical protein [Clavibacter sp. VKM Ac-2872]|uniref:hypothetical protein n=1 Tax=Clavibacter sp. VKM Ac-2872 TaxID=2783812 RepID=UPI00188A07B0|nr:hypothetical protein [Clavibacter sp. VKM Ac-2872]MBF4625207.1 hypothetical protein [Clavibacter sp. VKM Ac-2872]
MVTRRKISLVAAFAVLASLAGAAPALADNSGSLNIGCSISPRTPTLVNGGVIYSGGSATCSQASGADFRLVRNFNGTPDVRVANQYIPQTPSFTMTHYNTNCDGGGTGQYYTEIRLYAPGAAQRVSPTVTLSHC